MQVAESTVLVDGARVHFCQAGTGPALILVHGLVGSARNWDPNLAALARTRTVYAVDLANMGASERVAGLDPGLEAAADRIVQFMDAVGIATADIGGHSHGGAIVMMLAARHPGRVRKLVLFAPANPFCEAGRGLIAFYSTQLGARVARAIPAMPRLVHTISYRRMHGDPRRSVPSALDGYTGSLNRESINHILGVVRTWWADMAVLRSRLAELAGMPVLLIWGDRDIAVGVGSGRRLAELLGASLMVLPGVGHLAFEEVPEVCNAAVGEWLGA